MFSPTALKLDTAVEAARISDCIATEVLHTFRKRGVVVGVSGGIDSAVVAMLCAQALGKEHVLALLMPEHHSSGDSLALGRGLADAAGIEAIVEDIAPALEAAGCYRRQDEAIRSVVPEYGSGWKCKLVLPSVLTGDRLNVTRLTVQAPTAESKSVRLSAQAYRQLVAATNMKQRVRKITEYYHAERLNYAVAGTPNRLEYDQGFFVKHGDGAADLKPIAHLYKSQVYDLAEYLGVPAAIRARPPTTDTFSMEQTQEEFYFALPYRQMDLCLYAHNNHIAAAEAAPVLGLSPEQVERVYKDIEAKRRATRYLHTPALLVEPVREV
ncbi:MAG: NAD(+) synthase [Burkholderiales bacterium]